MSADIIFYEFSREKVERLDFTHFLSLYGPDKLPSGPSLRAMMNSMIFQIDGYNSDPREIHSIPEVRRFYSAFHEAWPYWLFFSNYDMENLMVMVFCCLKSLNVIQQKGKVRCGVECNPMELVRFIGRDFVAMNEMCEQAGFSEREIFERTKQTFQYFNLPFDAACPE